MENTVFTKDLGHFVKARNWDCFITWKDVGLVCSPAFATTVCIKQDRECTLIESHRGQTTCTEIWQTGDKPFVCDKPEQQSLVLH